MGSGNWTNDAHAAFISSASKAPGGAFAATHKAKAAIATGAPVVLDPLVDPKVPNKAGKKVLESLDSADHPESFPVLTLLDGTGSMGTIPRRIMDKLPTLMTALITKGYVPHPHIAFGMVGDAEWDKLPVQCTRYEAGNVLASSLGNLVIEGGGGGNLSESYELAMYYAAVASVLDSVIKRGIKGVCFIIGDEFATNRANPSKPRGTAAGYTGMLSKKHVKEYLDLEIEADIPFEDVLAMLREKYEVFWVYPKEAEYYTAYPQIVEHWKTVFGQNCLLLDSAENIVELIVGTVATVCGFELSTIAKDLSDLGASSSAVADMTSALTPYVGATAGLRTVNSTGAIVSGSLSSLTKGSKGSGAKAL